MAGRGGGAGRSSRPVRSGVHADQLQQGCESDTHDANSPPSRSPRPDAKCQDSGEGDGTLTAMPSISKEEQRAARMREYETLLERATNAVGALALVVQGREARARPDDAALEMSFAAADDAGRTLPAGLWVALRRGDVDRAVQLLADASDSAFVVGEIETMGTGYRLETVEEKRALPDPELLHAQLGGMLDIPVDVLRVLAEWGPDDPRTRSEVAALLDGRFGPDPSSTAPMDEEFPALTMGVAELSDVLQLTPKQAKVLTTLARRSKLTIIGSDD
jgi:hypothetical protein